MIRSLALAWVMVLCLAGSAFAEGFSMIEWSARGLALAGGMVGRADDASAIAYNAAGITQLPGTHMMVGASTITPYGDIKGVRADGTHFTKAAKVNTWTPAHAYITHQLNDNVWLGFGTFSRFGLGNSYSQGWFGQYNTFDVGIQTVSAVPTVAYKFNDMFSASLGVEFMYISMYMGQKIPAMHTPPTRFDNDMKLDGNGMGFGLHAGLHAKFDEQWSAGLTYKSQVTQNIYGDAKFDVQGANHRLAVAGGLPDFNQRNSNISGTLQLPDSVAFGLAYKPLSNLSFEVGTVWTRWSTYGHLNIYFDQPSGYRALSEKAWRDGWNFNASVEYSPLDWLTLRAGYWYETPVVNEKYADFMVPSYGRDVATVGAGFKWENWTLDLAYAHIWIHSLDYGNSRTSGVRNATALNGGIQGTKATDCHADMFSLSIGYSF